MANTRAQGVLWASPSVAQWASGLPGPPPELQPLIYEVPQAGAFLHPELPEGCPSQQAHTGGHPDMPHGYQQVYSGRDSQCSDRAAHLEDHGGKALLQKERVNVFPWDATDFLKERGLSPLVTPSRQGGAQRKGEGLQTSWQGRAGRTSAKTE